MEPDTVGKALGLNPAAVDRFQAAARIRAAFFRPAISARTFDSPLLSCASPRPGGDPDGRRRAGNLLGHRVAADGSAMAGKLTWSLDRLPGASLYRPSRSHRGHGPATGASPQ